MSMSPLIVCAITSKHGLRDIGPLWPKPEMRVTIRRGLSACNVSQSKPIFSSVPGT